MLIAKGGVEAEFIPPQMIGVGVPLVRCNSLIDLSLDHNTNDNALSRAIPDKPPSLRHLVSIDTPPRRAITLGHLSGTLVALGYLTSFSSSFYKSDVPTAPKHTHHTTFWIASPADKVQSCRALVPQGTPNKATLCRAVGPAPLALPALPSPHIISTNFIPFPSTQHNICYRDWVRSGTENDLHSTARANRCVYS